MGVCMYRYKQLCVCVCACVEKESQFLQLWNLYLNIRVVLQSLQFQSVFRNFFKRLYEGDCRNSDASHWLKCKKN